MVRGAWRDADPLLSQFAVLSRKFDLKIELAILERAHLWIGNTLLFCEQREAGPHSCGTFSSDHWIAFEVIHVHFGELHLNQMTLEVDSPPPSTLVGWLTSTI